MDPPTPQSWFTLHFSLWDTLYIRLLWRNRVVDSERRILAEYEPLSVLGYWRPCEILPVQIVQKFTTVRAGDLKNVVRWHSEKFVCLTHHWTILTFFPLTKGIKEQKNLQRWKKSIHNDVVLEKLWHKLLTVSIFSQVKKDRRQKEKQKIVKITRKKRRIVALHSQTSVSSFFQKNNKKIHT